MTVFSRRAVLRAGGLAGLAALLPAELLTRPLPAGATGRAGSAPGFVVFDAHEAAVVTEATARLIPGPSDDPGEVGHPGAREAGVVHYIDTLLGALELSPRKIFAGGPFSDRAGWPVDDMARFVGLSAAEERAWTLRLRQYRAAYAAGVVALDRLCRGSFLDATNEERDRALTADPDGFMTLLFGHAIEGMYSCPEYGGNRGLVGWREIGFPGDVQPRGYTHAEVTLSDGPDPAPVEPIVARLLALIEVSNEQ